MDIKFEFDRSAFEMHSHETNEPAINYWKNKTIEERLAAAFYLNSVAYNFDINSPPAFDRTAFSMRKNEE